ncbi:MAG: tRNA (cytidine(34)-2'-O)-methyltransferase [Oligoflexia bacterium]|nr:tRNA (cytidine(34)-2'-O)-methyltransferase [Oligoflexia bacterium]MBF0366651.1 tRNA (cytidine(34)-2'-O)-methyltransferase [Oligoflexia bacterium]
MSAPFKIVLVHPEIPGNTGSIGRTAVALGVELILIHPLGFDLSEKAVRRAGLDYWKHVQLKEYANFDDFMKQEAPKREQLFFFSRFAKTVYYKANFCEGAYVIFGAETKGLPTSITEEFSDRSYVLPTFSPHIRSLNLANTATAVTFEVLRQLRYCGEGL